MLIPDMTIFIGNINRTIRIADIAINGILSNLGYLILQIISNDTMMLNIIAIYGLNNPLRYNVANMKDIPGIGNPIKSVVSIFPAITLYLVNLKTPQITINKLINIVTTWKMPGVVLMQLYRNTAGATPNETMSDKESMFFPNPKSSCLFVFLATQPSHESNMIATIIRTGASSKLFSMELMIARNPELIFINDMMSDIAMKLFIFVSILLIF